MKRIRILSLLLLAVLLLSSCGKKEGKPLPAGMDETTLLDAGREVVALLAAEDWQGVYDKMRPDGQQTADPDAIQTYMEKITDKCGAYVSETEALATGQKLDSGEEYGTAVFYCKHAKKNVLYRVAFSAEMELMGFEARKQSIF